MRAPRRLVVEFGLLVLGAVLGGCSAPDAAGPSCRYRETKLLLGTVVHVDVCWVPGQERQRGAAYRDVWTRMVGIHRRMNAFDEQGDIAKINHSYGSPVQVGGDTYGLLEDAFQMHALTGGKFDVTVGPLLDLFRKAEAAAVFPTTQEIRAKLTSVGMDKVRLLPEGRIETLDPQTRVDLGGMAKGYAVDEAARILRGHGFTNFYVDAGGDLYVGGRNCEGNPWRIGIRDPRDAAEVIEVVELTDSAITTSGNYEQSFSFATETGTQQYSHIIDPLSGVPAMLPDSKTGEMIASMTVIAPRAVTADVLSTAFMIFDGAGWKDLLDARGETYAGLRISVNPDQGTYGKDESRAWARYSVKK